MNIKKVKYTPSFKMNLQRHAEGGTDDVLKSFKEISTEIKDMIEKQNEEVKENGTVTTETKEALEGLSEKFNELQKHYDDLDAKMQRGELGESQAEEVKTLGEMFTESDQYNEMVKRGAKSSDELEIKSFHTKDLSSNIASAGTLVQPQRAAMITPPLQALRIRDLLGQSTTSSNAIEYVKETGYTNNAAAFGEFSSEDELQKPKSDLTFDIESVTVKNIGHWLPATRQIISDAKQLKGYVDGRLIYGLKLEEESQLLYGDGIGENISGIIPAASDFDETRLKSGDTKIDILRRAITQSVLAGYPVSGIVLHPNDWEDIELAKGSDGHYIWVSVQDGGTTKLWKVPVVDTVAIKDGTFLVGAFKMGATVWDREQASIRVSDSHDKFFTKNMIAILAEERLALTIYRPESFIHGTFPAILPVA